IRPTLAENTPGLWFEEFRWPRLEDHKYRRGHLLIAGGDVMTGAARMAARGARRIGTGLVTLACARASHPIYAADAAGLITAGFAALLADTRRNVLLIGPGHGVTPQTRRRAIAGLIAGKRSVIDADALTVFADNPQDLFAAARAPSLLTPHEGEFARLFPDLA